MKNSKTPSRPDSKWLALAAFVLMSAVTPIQAQIQTAGTVFINVDATAMSVGSGSNVINSGSLGGYFVANTNTLIATASNVNAIVLGGTNYFRLLDGQGNVSALIPPPAGLIGSNATCSIEVWAFNPQVAGDESMIAWGARVAGQNMAFEYGNGSSGGAQHNGADIPWDPIGGGAPLNNYWHHLVYTYDGTNQNLYADGVLANSQPVNFSTVANQGIALGAQWGTAAATTPGTSPGLATLALARIRVHDGTLTPAQVLNNYNFEKSTFVPAAITPTFLTAGPVHRYSFNEPATNDATGLAFADSIGAANGVVQGSEANSVASFSGRRLVLKGGIQTTLAGYGAPYGDLPNGLVSANSTNNGGSGELSIEIWWKNYGGTTPGTTGNGPWSWCRVFDIGSCGLTTPFPATGVEVAGPGGYPTGGGQLDYFIYSAQVGNGYAAVNQRQLGWQNKDSLPANTTTNAGSVTQNVQTMGTYMTDRHVVVTWKESTGQITAYENGVQVASVTALNAMSALNDINVWLGRSQSGTDSGFAGEYDEVRFYNYALSPAQALGDFQVGPNTINTAVQAVTISTQPQNSTVNQGWPATFYVTASGSPAASYQWSRNGTPISGATTDTYSLAAAGLANNGDTYSCVVSNFANSTPNTVTSSSATLTVQPNAAPMAAILHETKEANPTAALGSQRDDYNGVVGTAFQSGPAGALVTHLGYYDVYGDGLTTAHNVGVFNASGSTMLASVSVPPGNDPSTYLTNGYRYVALATPILLAPNTTYILEGEAFKSDGDMWADLWQVGQWNSYFVGTNTFSTRTARYDGPWPGAATSVNTANSTYGAPNLATLPLGPAQVWAAQTGVTQYVGIPVTLTVLANGQAPMALQWYKAPNTLLTGQNSSSLVIANPTLSDSGNYYAIVSNSFATNQSANITLTVLGNTPVVITLQPTNLTVPQGFSASFTVAASGTPPISYRWLRNGITITGETNTTYNIAAVSLANNGDLYSCVVSNHTTTANVVTSSNAMLTVQPNQAPPSQLLYPPVAGLRNDYGGVVGGIFQVGASPAKVTHLGFYSTNGILNNAHHVGIFPATGGNTPLASVIVQPGTLLYTNSYVWVALDAPITLAANTSYVLGGEVFANDGDVWPDQYVPTPWNPYYVGANPISTRLARYGGAWPATPSANNAANSIYGAPNMAILSLGPPIVQIQQTNVSAYAGSNVTISAFVDGDAPLTVQWYKAPGTLLSGQTSNSLNFASVTVSDSGSYYLIASNDQGSVQSSNVTLNVLALTPPIINQQPQSQTVYLHQRANFSVTAVGQQPLSYQWNLNGTPIAGATSSSLTVLDSGAAKTGNYQVTVSNSLGATNSTLASLTLLSVPANSYPAAVLNANPAVYYRFSEAGGSSAAVNLGNLGAANNGIYEGSIAGVPGPVPPTFANFETNNLAAGFDGIATDVNIPPMNFDTNAPVAVTLAAWINTASQQAPYAGIIFNRGANGANGFGIKQDPGGSDELEYHWNNLYFGYNSELLVPVSQWVFVALVVEPTQATFYLHDGTGWLSATNVATHTAVAFDDNSTYVGWDPISAGARRFYGSIDEPMVFNRALALSELNALYGAAINQAVTLTIAVSGSNVVLTWPAGTLQQADNVAGPYSNVAGATSPYTTAPTGAQKFYRIK